MATKGSRAALVIGSFVVIGGVVAYFLLRNRKSKNEKTGDTPPSTGESSAYTPSSSTPSSSGGSSSTSQYTFPFKTTEEGNKFREWVNNTYPDWAKKNKLDRSGSLNSYLEKAWKEYGSKYTQQGSSSSSVKQRLYVTLKDGQLIYKSPKYSPNDITSYKAWVVDNPNVQFTEGSPNIIKDSNGIIMLKVTLPPKNVRYIGWTIESVTGYVAMRDALKYEWGTAD